ncbi:hypothetical protein TNCT_22531 [Trichonephila clavata]|uniref:Uncharacterized protein n=1 Tax=Trichonephila clavata TaxID=2740835 RepID=A0A8X6LME5_TRICU|nr:hypothetical protein TNCT_22531 [Trichonephila clavata]
MKVGTLLKITILINHCEGRIKSDNSIIDKQKDIDAFLRGLEEINSFSLFPLRSNISETSEQSSESSSVTPLVQGSKYVFYDDNGKKFIIDNADFEEEEKELIDIFNSNSTLLINNPNSEFFENRSYNDTCHFYPISTNAPSENIIDEDVNENFVDYQTDKEVKEITADYHTDEDEKENTVDYNTNEEVKEILSNYHTDKRQERKNF